MITLRKKENQRKLPYFDRLGEPWVIVSNKAFNVGGNLLPGAWNENLAEMRKYLLEKLKEFTSEHTAVMCPEGN